MTDVSHSLSSRFGEWRTAGLCASLIPTGPPAAPLIPTGPSPPLFFEPPSPRGMFSLCWLTEGLVKALEMGSLEEGLEVGSLENGLEVGGLEERLEMGSLEKGLEVDGWYVDGLEEKLAEVDGLEEGLKADCWEEEE